MLSNQPEDGVVRRAPVVGAEAVRVALAVGRQAAVAQALTTTEAVAEGHVEGPVVQALATTVEAEGQAVVVLVLGAAGGPGVTAAEGAGVTSGETGGGGATPGALPLRPEPAAINSARNCIDYGQENVLATTGEKNPEHRRP